MPEPLSSTDPQVIRTLSAAEGYCRLGMWDDAWSELDSLRPADQKLTITKLLRMEVHSGRKEHQETAALAEELLRSGVTDGAVYLKGAYAIRRSRSLAEAEQFLLSGKDSLKGEAMYHYNLACYACVAGREEEALERLRAALKLDANYRELAVDDEDLKSLKGRF